MKGAITWSYKLYKPPLYNTGDIYISRIVPQKNSVHIEWLGKCGNNYEIFCRKRGEKVFLSVGKSDNSEFDIINLTSETDYEIFVACGTQKSRVRLARCGESIGTVVNYLHPDDDAYDFSGRYLCSPSLLRHPDGYLLSSMDVYNSDGGQNLTLIFRSDDNGKTWHYVCELFPCFWGKMFLHKGEVYMLACSTEYGDLLIGKSRDGGMSFDAPTVLLRGTCGRNPGGVGVHKNPQNVVRYGGRIYNTLEWGSWNNKEYCHAAMVMSADENSDLLDCEAWSFTEPLKFAPWCDEIKNLSSNTLMIEGTLVVSPDGKLKNIMRFGKYHRALCLDVDTENCENPLCFNKLISFPGNLSKFMIKYDSVSGYYYSIAIVSYDETRSYARNLLSLVRSRDLEEWEYVCNLFDYRSEPSEKIGFQYADFEIEGNDIIFLLRTAINNAFNYHNSNYQTFHKIKNFRTDATLE